MKAHQFLDQAPNFGGGVARNNLDIANSGTPKGFLFYSIASGCFLPDVVASALKFDCVQRLAVSIHDQQVNALGIDCPKGVLVITPQYFTQTDLPIARQPGLSDSNALSSTESSRRSG